ncbi:MAG: UDP-2,3-diacylglucosamine diphosphatase, partial [Methylococcaceae bacterium]|nr:UDP-2,3-diacylglucosamine diphosphatase [Methylococcaceae bacterium]
MHPETLFISDLHLRPMRPAITRKFLDFLAIRARGAAALYILGDLFDTWVGDDDPSPPGRKVKAALRRLTDSGTPVYFQHGNRDFLIGKRFLEETGLRLLEDYSVIDLYGSRTLLMHGDLLCTDDLPYLEFRKKARSPEWQAEVLSKPVSLRLAYARWYRLRSYFHKRNKTAEIMDVNPQTVESVMLQHRVLRLIHGHTHRPAEHRIEINGALAQRFVLAQWE